MGCDESCGLELLGVVKWCEFGGERKRRKGGDKRMEKEGNESKEERMRKGGKRREGKEKRKGKQNENR